MDDLGGIVTATAPVGKWLCESMPPGRGLLVGWGRVDRPPTLPDLLMISTSLTCWFLLAATPLAGTEAKTAADSFEPRQSWRGAELTGGRGFAGAYNLAVAPDGRTLAFRGSDQLIHLVDLTEKRPVQTLNGHEDVIGQLQFTPDGKTLLSLSAAELIAWNLAEGSPRWRQPGGTRLRLRTEGDSAALVRQGAVAELELASGETTQRHPTARRVWAFEPSGDLLLATRSSRDPVLSLLKLDATTQLSQYSGFGAGELREIRFTPDGGSFLAAVSAKEHAIERLLVWDQVGGPLRRIPAGGASVFAISPDSLLVATDDAEGAIQIWELASGTSLGRLSGHSRRPSDLLFASDRLLVSGGQAKDPRALAVWSIDDWLLQPRGAEGERLEPGPIPPVAALWQLTGSSDPREAWRAVVQLSRSKDAIDLLEEKWEAQVGAARPADVAKLVADLAAVGPGTRQRATEALLRLRPAEDRRLREALRDAETLEARLRLRKILSTPVGLHLLPEQDRLRLERSLAALKRIGSPRAKALLTRIGGWDLAPTVARRARAAATN